MADLFLKGSSVCHKQLRASWWTALHIHRRVGDALCEVMLTFLRVIIYWLFIPMSHRSPEKDIFSCSALVEAVLSHGERSCPCLRGCCAASSPLLQGQPHKAFTVLQGDDVHARGALQRLRRSSDNDDHSISCSVARQQVVDGVLVHRTDT